MIETSVFRMPQRSLISYLFRRYGKGWLISAGIATAGLILCALILGDVRYAIIAMMIIFIIIPLAMAFLYLNHALKPGVSFNILPHTLSLRTNEVIVKVIKSEIDLEEKREKKSKKKKKKKLSLWEEDMASDGITSSASEDIEYLSQKESSSEPEVSYLHLPLSHIDKYEVGLNSVIIKIAGSSKISDGTNDERTLTDGIVYLPLSAFPSASEYSRFLNELYASIKK